MTAKNTKQPTKKDETTAEVQIAETAIIETEEMDTELVTQPDFSLLNHFPGLPPVQGTFTFGAVSGFYLNYNRGQDDTIVELLERGELEKNLNIVLLYRADLTAAQYYRELENVSELVFLKHTSDDKFMLCHAILKTKSLKGLLAPLNKYFIENPTAKKLPIAMNLGFRNYKFTNENGENVTAHNLTFTLKQATNHERKAVEQATEMMQGVGYTAYQDLVGTYRYTPVTFCSVLKSPGQSSTIGFDTDNDEAGSGDELKDSDDTTPPF